MRARKGDKTNQTKQKSTLSRLLVANLVAALALLTTAVAVLWALGLFGSVLAYFF